MDDKPLLVLLNSCHSAAQTGKLVDTVPFAIGMSDTIGDIDAITYSARFYTAVGDGQSVQGPPTPSAGRPSRRRSPCPGTSGSSMVGHHARLIASRARVVDVGDAADIPRTVTH